MVEVKDDAQRIKEYVKEHFYGEYLEGLKGINHYFKGLKNLIQNLFAFLLLLLFLMKNGKRIEIFSSKWPIWSSLLKKLGSRVL